MMATRLFLVRHGQVAGYEEKRYNGQANIPLTDRGRGQIDQLCSLLAQQPLHAIYTSDLDRCTYGADQLAAQTGLPAVRETAFREIHCGTWQGKAWSDLKQEFPAEWQARLRNIAHFRFPGGESFHDAAARVRPALQSLLNQHRGQNIVMFSHGGINRIVLLDALGAPLDCAFVIEQNYACLNIIDYRADGYCRIRLVNGPCPIGAETHRVA